MDLTESLQSALDTVELNQRIKEQAAVKESEGKKEKEEKQQVNKKKMIIQGNAQFSDC